MHKDRAEDCKEIERIIGYSFRDPALLLTAFTHSTYAEHFGEESNERLEFLGDAVLQLVVTEMLYAAMDGDEGVLTERRKQYVSKHALERAEGKMGLMRYLRYFGGEESVGGKTSSNLFEAVAGAIYLDGGLAPAAQFIRSHISVIRSENYKSMLQEYVQERERETPRYRVTATESGFECTASALGASATGMGASKKAAETEAARKLLETFKKGERA